MEYGNQFVVEGNLTNFYEFIENLRAFYPYAAIASILEEVAYARTVGPIGAGFHRVNTNEIWLIASIGFGDRAIITLQYVAPGHLEPVSAGILKDLPYGKEKSKKP